MQCEKSLITIPIAILVGLFLYTKTLTLSDNRLRTVWRVQKMYVFSSCDPANNCDTYRTRSTEEVEILSILKVVVLAYEKREQADRKKSTDPYSSTVAVSRGTHMYVAC